MVMFCSVSLVCSCVDDILRYRSSGFCPVFILCYFSGILCSHLGGDMIYLLLQRGCFFKWGHWVDHSWVILFGVRNFERVNFDALPGRQLWRILLCELRFNSVQLERIIFLRLYQCNTNITRVTWVVLVPLNGFLSQLKTVKTNFFSFLIIYSPSCDPQTFC